MATEAAEARARELWAEANARDITLADLVWDDPEGMLQDEEEEVLVALVELEGRTNR